MKKGFTLIELLAVIMIIGLLSIIAVPTVANVLKDGRKRAFKQQIIEIEKSAKIYYQEELADSENDHAYLDLSKTSDRNKLQVKTNIKAGIVDISSNGKIDITALNDEFCGRKESKETKISLLSLDNLYCLLADSNNTSGVTNAGEILSKFNQLQGEIDELKDEVTSLKSKNTTLEENLQTVSTVADSSTLDKVYPVGSIYMSLTESTASGVASKFGGTWVAFGQGRTLIGVGSNGTTNYSTVNSTGGSEIHNHEFDHTHGVPGVAHKHGTSSMSAAIGASLGFAQTLGYVAAGAAGSNSTYTVIGTGYINTNNGGYNHPRRSHNTAIVGTTDNATPSATTTNSISSKYTDNASSIQPYITVYMYKRTA